MKVHEIMSPQVESIPPQTSLKRAAQKMRDLNVGSLTVVENEQLLGIITDRDISCYAIAIGYDPNLTEVSNVMNKNVATCFVDEDINHAAHVMEQRHVRRLAVLHQDNSLAGFLSVDDLARCSHDLAGAVLQAATQIH